jgi:hypothetical protein
MEGTEGAGARGLAGGRDECFGCVRVFGGGKVTFEAEAFEDAAREPMLDDGRTGGSGAGR